MEDFNVCRSNEIASAWNVFTPNIGRRVNWSNDGENHVGEVSSIFTFSSRFAKKVKSKNTPKKVRIQPTTHVTETSFFHVLDPPDHFGTFYIFNHFYSCGLSTATIEYSSPSVCLCVCLSVYTITKKIMVQSTWNLNIL